MPRPARRGHTVPPDVRVRVGARMSGSGLGPPDARVRVRAGIRVHKMYSQGTYKAALFNECHQQQKWIGVGLESRPG